MLNSTGLHPLQSVIKRQQLSLKKVNELGPVGAPQVLQGNGAPARSRQRDIFGCLLLLHDVLLLLKPHVCHVRCCWSRKDRHAWHHRSLLPCSLVHLFCKQPLLPHQILRRRPRRLRLCRGHPSWRWVVRLLWSEGRFLWHGWWDRRRERRFGWERGLHGCSPHLGRRHLPFHMVACRGRLL